MHSCGFGRNLARDLGLICQSWPSLARFLLLRASGSTSLAKKADFVKEIGPQAGSRLQTDDGHAFISRVQPETANAEGFPESSVQGGTDASSASSVNEPQLVEVRKERLV
jgi:hypothetical protein